MSHEYQVIDAFTSEALTGNPAAVVFDADDLPDEAMGAIAAEFNLSETTFVLRPGDTGADVRFRWFTPTREVDLCGHATLAGVHAMIDTRRFAGAIGAARDTIRIQTRSGILEARPERIAGSSDVFLVWLELPRPSVSDFVLRPSVVRDGLRIPDGGLVSELPVMVTGDRDVILFVRDGAVLNAVEPDFRALARQSAPDRVRGFLVATLGTLAPSIQVQSRFFAPACGIDEDPVTGSVHGPLLAYLVRHGRVVPVNGLAGASCIQSTPGRRSGLVRVLGRADGRVVTDVQIGGRCCTVMRGTLVL